jgi:hypothetical protein
MVRSMTISSSAPPLIFRLMPSRAPPGLRARTFRPAVTTTSVGPWLVVVYVPSSNQTVAPAAAWPTARARVLHGAASVAQSLPVSLPSGLTNTSFGAATCDGDGDIAGGAARRARGGEAEGGGGGDRDRRAGESGDIADALIDREAGGAGHAPRQRGQPAARRERARRRG